MPNIIEELQEVKKASQAQTNASQELADEVSGKMGAIDKKADDAISQVQNELESFKANVQNIIPTPLNLYKNSLMRAVESDGRPTGFSSSGCILEAVHPFTKGFEGPYVAEKPATAVETVDAATGDNPYWYGRYNKGTRNWRGGLADGWYGISDGHILKITSDPKAQHKQIKPTVEALGKFSQVRVRFWIKIVSGTFYMGSTSGYYNGRTKAQTRNNPITKAQTDAAADGWLYVDKVIGISEVTNLNGHAFCWGVNCDEVCEIYIAQPHLSVPMRSETMLVAAGETRAEPVFTPHELPQA